MDSGTFAALIGLIGVLMGALLSPYMFNKLNSQFGKRNLIFQRKLEYFEKIVETMEKNRKMYMNAVSKLENSKMQIEKIIDEIKKERINFLKKASPLYFNTQRFSEKIIHFVRIEKNIFHKIEQIKDNEKEKENIIEHLKDDLKKLNIKGNEILYEMKKELKNR